ncbi:MAG: hypothetical protein ACYTBS_24835, partial [Planctomycetota bacterium]
IRYLEVTRGGRVPVGACAMMTNGVQPARLPVRFGLYFERSPTRPASYHRSGPSEDIGSSRAKP